MYRLDRTRRLKFAALAMAFLSAVLTAVGYACGGDELLDYGFMNDPFGAILMIAAFFSTVIFLFFFKLIDSIEKDMAENLKSIDKDRN